LWGGMTASHFLRQANIKKGRKVLVYGASGSVGSSAVQIAKYLGAEVTGVCSTGNLAMVLSLGADKAIDYKFTNFTKSNEKYDFIFDTVGKTSILETIRSLTLDGIYIHAVTTPATEIRIRLGLISSRKKLIGGTFNTNSELLNYVIELAKAGALKAVVDTVYPMEEIVEAHRYVDKGHKKGNVIITMNNDKFES
jgi:NADPH:quinone reductase-like Zn-dependent oxidoreductase